MIIDLIIVVIVMMMVLQIMVTMTVYISSSHVHNFPFLSFVLYCTTVIITLIVALMVTLE